MIKRENRFFLNFVNLKHDTCVTFYSAPGFSGNRNCHQNPREKERKIFRNMQQQ